MKFKKKSIIKIENRKKLYYSKKIKLKIKK